MKSLNMKLSGTITIDGISGEIWSIRQLSKVEIFDCQLKPDMHHFDVSSTRGYSLLENGMTLRSITECIKYVSDRIKTDKIDARYEAKQVK